MPIKQFEEAVIAQQAVPPAHYNASYFHENWRTGTNNYSVEVRRKIEGRNPELIKEVFQPMRVLDFGCGPGALLYLLNEIGVDVHGLDYSEYAKTSAPPEIQERIHVIAADDPMPWTNAFDLVVCREVLEHLTARQIQRAVQNMCQVSSRFIYVTTRYSKNIQDLLSLETEFEVDPSHISLLNKDFLRVLFVLQGFKSRYDLEAKMDWKNYGRVLVLEKDV